MNRTDRLLAIVLELQGKVHQRAEDLATTFETSKRTIYRDMLALGEAGVPIVSIPGRGYSLMQGYFLPPLSFTTDEATMLLLGSDLMAQNFDAQYRQAAQSASRKIEGVLPDKLRDEVHSLQSSIRFVAASPETPEAEHRILVLQQLRRAILQHSIVRFTYHTRHAQGGQSEQNTREADPYGLIHFPIGWHLVAYCHLRQGIRNFRLDRIDNLELLSKTFQRPANFVMREDTERSSQRDIVVRVHFRSRYSALGAGGAFILHRRRRRHARWTAGNAPHPPGERNHPLAFELGTPCQRAGTGVAARAAGGGGGGDARTVSTHDSSQAAGKRHAHLTSFIAHSYNNLNHNHKFTSLLRLNERDIYMLPDLSGRLLDNYRLIQHLDAGSFGAVYQATNLHNEQVAVKVFEPFQSHHDRQQFYDEVRALLLLRHKHIIPIKDFGVDKKYEYPYIAMEYAPNSSLKQCHPMGTRLPLATVVQYVKPLAEALQFAHDNRLIHRDVKPDNVLIGSQNKLLLSDFGISAPSSSFLIELDQTLLPRTGGTVYYMAPEQCRGFPEKASDQYALAIMVYQWLCGQPPFMRGSSDNIQFQHVHEPVPPLHNQLPDISPEVESAILRALSKAPEKRYATVTDFANALEQAWESTLKAVSQPSNLSLYSQIVADYLKNQSQHDVRGPWLGKGKFAILQRIYDRNGTEINKVLKYGNPSQLYAAKSFYQVGEEGNEFFWREIEMLKLLKHSSLPSFMESHQVKEDDFAYLIMEFIPGCSLEYILNKLGGSLDEVQVIRWMIDICDALDYLHSRKPPILLGEIQPNDILVTVDGSIKLVNVGTGYRYKQSKPPRNTRKCCSKTFHHQLSVTRSIGIILIAEKEGENMKTLYILMLGPIFTR